ncbi:hypothetical protein CEY16_00565 [Halalkalibacillus sediminis]|uniref:Cell wall-active antibiotics response protein n=1 Tax=Halalkalibacillus sediminis TaxID=2018042 RepID=A0A2I0QVF0_9BACI|nr:cell wall-active antibiotics response protein LiaF [Halalkalibacillus sediminis]PKR78284.1 hypothetical protein CEY16_00565 [Halalkalibacillus sediminis]
MFLTKFIKLLIAFFLILLGVTFLMTNLNIISLEISNVVWDSWPVILILLGLISIRNNFHPNKGGSWFFGFLMIIFGGLLWAGNFGYIDFSFIDIWKLWPLLLIYIGANIMFGKKALTVKIVTSEDEAGKTRKQWEYHANEQAERKFSKEKEKRNHRKNNDILDDIDDQINDAMSQVDDALNQVSNTFKSDKKKDYKRYSKVASKHFILDMNYSKDDWEVEPLDISTGISNLYFDFSKAYIPDYETNINLRGYIADVVMKIPEHIPVRISGKVNIGEVTIFDENSGGLGNAIKYESPDYQTATRKLDIHMNYRIGEVQVISV